jgi:Flp pilus assembly protein TadG
MLIGRSSGKRRGATVVETGVVMIPVTMLLFAIFEFGWLLMNWNVLNNAAREGCRYALVNNTSPTITSDVQTVVNSSMATTNRNFSNFTITVSGSHNGVSTSTTSGINALVAGDLISVTVQGQYRFMNVIPFMQMPATVTITSNVTMVCEGAT